MDRESLSNRHIWPKDGKEMVYIPEGEFLYGENKEKVSLHAYWIDKTPVTNGEFARFVGATGYVTTAEKTGIGCANTRGKWKDIEGANWRYPGGHGSGDIESKADHPVVQVSWEDAAAYAEWAGKRLPTGLIRVVNARPPDLSGKLIKQRLYMKYSQLNLLWQSIVGLLAPVILTLLLIQIIHEPGLNLYQWLMWLHVPFLFMHEYEEYVISPDGFKKFANTHTLISLSPPQEDTPVNDEMIFVINMIGWIWAIAGALLAQIAPWIGAGFLILQILINCLTHPVIFQLRRKAYNPGLGTTLGILIPYITFVFWYIVTNNLFTTTDWILTFVLGIGVSVQLPIWSINRIRDKKAQQTH